MPAVKGPPGPGSGAGLVHGYRRIALEGAIDRGAGHGEQLGEVGDGVLAGADHAHEFALLLG